MSGVLIDANLLCLLVVGSLDSRHIRDHSRLRAFGEDDYHNIITVLDRLGDPILCPHVLTETSNLIAYRQQPRQLLRLRRAFAHIIGECVEQSRRALDAVNDPMFDRLGLADSVLMLLAADGTLFLLTDDLHLYQETVRRGLKAVNYNYIRDGALRIDQIG